MVVPNISPTNTKYFIILFIIQICLIKAKRYCTQNFYCCNTAKTLNCKWGESRWIDFPVPDFTFFIVEKRQERNENSACKLNVVRRVTVTQFWIIILWFNRLLYCLSNWLFKNALGAGAKKISILPHRAQCSSPAEMRFSLAAFMKRCRWVWFFTDFRRMIHKANR